MGDLSWKDYLKFHWPYVVMFAFFIVSGIFTAGVEHGKALMLQAGVDADREARGG